MARFLTAAGLALAMVANSGHVILASTIQWGTPQSITGDADVSTLGALVYAYNFGPPGVTNTTVNGVTFQAFGIPDFSPSETQGAVTISEYPSRLSNGSWVSGSNPFAALTPAYKSLVSTNVTAMAPDTITLTLGGLTAGTEYDVQWWSSRATTPVYATTASAGNSVTLRSNMNPEFSEEGGLGQYVIGRFTASGTTQAIDFTGSTLYGSSTMPAINGFQVRAVPEPATYAVALAGLACGGFSMWRSRRRVGGTRSPIVVASLVLAAAHLCAAPAHAAPITIDWVMVGDPGNIADTIGYGAVNYEYNIGKYEVTIGQYTEFLNAVDPGGTNPYGVYNGSMETDGNMQGILFRPGSASGQKYSPIGSPNRPITYVSWFDAARFANWMQNGQGNGSTETGAYTLAGQTSGTAPGKNDGAQFYIPTENEWYKAAYFSPVLNSGSGGYHTYATQSNTAPGNNIGAEANQANYYAGSYAVTQSSDYDSGQNYLTDVGVFTNSASYYGTFDQSGNAWEWNDLTGDADLDRGLRGGDWFNGALNLSSSYGFTDDPSLEGSNIGFRLASPVPVPEPSTWLTGLAGIACAGWTVWRRRRARYPDPFGLCPF